MKRVLEYDHNEARRYFLKTESYFSFDLPQYFAFQNILDKVSKKLGSKPIEDFYLNPPDYSTKRPEPKHPFPSDFENVNYKLLNNKDGKFAWRPFQLIHPALYVSLVHKITEEKHWKEIVAKFKEFGGNPKIICQSIPIESEDKDSSDKATTIHKWWSAIEQKSIELAMTYDYFLHTDITDCYGSIYTHSISWALHTKAVGKSKRNDYTLIGNCIDRHLQNMAYGQTNGIPQGSVLMDFIAEIVLGYIDLELSKKIEENKIKDYHIIRYRDDYRIFTNNPQEGEIITKLLTEILIELGMRLNAQKTIVSNNVVRDSIKPDKLYAMTAKRSAKNLQTHLLIIHELSQLFPNSGRLKIALSNYFKRIEGITETRQNVAVLISIMTDIAYKNPQSYSYASAILSKLLSLIKTKEEQENILNLIKNKFKKLPNTGHLKIWLQRLTIKIDRSIEYDEKLCQKVNDKSIEIWNTEWLNAELKSIIVSEVIIDEDILSRMDKVITSEEVELFKTKSDSGDY